MQCRSRREVGDTANHPSASKPSGTGLGLQGAEPLAKINLGSPPSPAGKGVGGWGQTNSAKVGDEPETPGQAPSGYRKPPGKPMPRGFSRGVARGEAPGKTNLKSPPSQAGEERSSSAGRGMGDEKLMRGQVQPTPPPANFTKNSMTLHRKRRTTGSISDIINVLRNIRRV